MKLIVGLGNIGPRYDKTRHNVGFEVLDLIAQQQGDSPRKRKFAGEVAEIRLCNQPVMLLWPHTLMNRSGRSVREGMQFFKLPLESLLVISDDFNLATDRLRFRKAGSAGGQNGLKDIIRQLGTDAFARLRVGVGPVPAGWNAADFVLGKFRTAERSEVEVSIQQAADGIRLWVEEGIDACMNRYNGPRAEQVKDAKQKPDGRQGDAASSPLDREQ